MVNVGDLVVSVNGWEGWLFVVTEVSTDTGMGGYDPIKIQCVVVKAPRPDRGFPVGYSLRWLAIDLFRKIDTFSLTNETE